MKNNRELKYNEPNKKKLTKFNFIVIIVPIVLILLIAGLIAYYVFIYSSENNKMRRYLESDGYICNDSSCTKSLGYEIYTIDFVDNIFMVDNTNLQIRVGKDSPIVDIKDKEIICTYVKDDYNWDFVDDTFIYDKQCENYVHDINEYLSYYMSIRQKALGLESN